MDVVVSLKIRDSLVGLQKTVFIWKKTASGLKCTIGKRTAVDRAISFVPRNEPFKVKLCNSNWKAQAHCCEY